jgi:photosystem II P680 reaction center D1 protein
MLGVVGILGGAFLSVIHGSLVNSSLIRETTELESTNDGYHFGQAEVTYNLLASHTGYLGRLLIPSLAFRNSRSVHFLLAAFPTIGIWFATLGIISVAFNLNGFNFNHSILDSNGQVIRTDADLLSRANLGIQKMYAPNAHNFPKLL